MVFSYTTQYNYRLNQTKKSLNICTQVHHQLVPIQSIVYIAFRNISIYPSLVYEKLGVIKLTGAWNRLFHLELTDLKASHVGCQSPFTRLPAGVSNISVGLYRLESAQTLLLVSPPLSVNDKRLNMDTIGVHLDVIGSHCVNT